MKKLMLVLLLGAAPLCAQIPAPQINLGGNIGCQGFPCVNNGTLNLTTDADHTLTAVETSAFYMKVTSSVALTSPRTLYYPAGRFPVGIENATTGGQNLNVCSTSGACISIPNSTTTYTPVWNDGTNFIGAVGSGSGSNAFSALTSGTNTTAAMLVGTGASLSATNLGTINATAINGVSITGTPTAGYVPIATSATTALWGIGTTNVSVTNPSGRAFGTVYQNTGTSALIVQATGAITGSFGQGFGITGYLGASAGSLAAASVGQVHNDQGAATETLVVPAGDYYKIAVDNTYVTNGQNPSVLYWAEQAFLGGGGGGGSMTWPSLPGIAACTGTPCNAWATSYGTSGTGTALALTASPALTGTPTAPTPSTSDNSTEIATTAYTRAYVASLAYVTGSGTSGHCVQWGASNTLGDAGAACGSGGSAFSSLTSGTNTSAAMVVGSGASLGYTGTGSNNASSLQTLTPEAPGTSGDDTVLSIRAASLTAGDLVSLKDTSGSTEDSGIAASSVCLTTEGCLAINTVNIEAAPYYASGSSYATTVSSLASGSTTLTLAGGCGDFAVSGAGSSYGHEGVYIAGAGAAGTLQYIGTVSSCVGSTMTLAAATQTSVASASTTGTLVVQNEVIAVASGTGIIVGDTVTGTGIPSGTEVVALSGTSITLSQTPTTAGSGVALTFAPTVMHDETNALQGAFSALASTGGVIALPNGTYNLNGPLQETSGADAVVKVPEIPYGASGTNVPPVTITLQGVYRPTGGSLQGTIIQTIKQAGNLLGGSCSTCATTPYPNFTNVWLNLANLTFRAYPNPQVTMVNAANIVAFNQDHLWCDTGAPGGFEGAETPPVATHPNGRCFIHPSVLNNVAMNESDVWTYGYYTGEVLTEHNRVNSVYALYDTNGWELDGYNNSTGANSISVGYMWCQQCAHVISAGSTVVAVSINDLDIEGPTSTAIYDPNNYLYGHINFNLPYEPAGYTGVPTTSGAGNLLLHSLTSPNLWVLGSVVNGTGGASFFNPDIISGNYINLLVGKSASANNSGGITYIPNATANLSTISLAIWGQAGLQINGLNQATLSGTGWLKAYQIGAGNPTTLNEALTSAGGIEAQGAITVNKASAFDIDFDTGSGRIISFGANSTTYGGIQTLQLTSTGTIYYPLEISSADHSVGFDCGVSYSNRSSCAASFGTDGGQLGPASAPTGSCTSTQGGEAVISQDASLTFCPIGGGTWTAFVAANANELLGKTWAVPGTIGSTTPNTGAFTTLAANSFTLGAASGGTYGAFGTPGAYTTATIQAIAPTAGTAFPLITFQNAATTGTTDRVTYGSNGELYLTSGLGFGGYIGDAGTPGDIGWTGTGQAVMTDVQTSTSANSDLNGEVTLSSGSYTYTFNRLGRSSHPICVATDTTAANAVQVSYGGGPYPTAYTVTFHGTSTDVLDYICTGRN